LDEGTVGAALANEDVTPGSKAKEEEWVSSSKRAPPKEDAAE